MFNQLVKWTIIVGIWRKYKHHVFASLALLFALLIINYVHLDFVEYATASSNQNLGLSYLAKWLAFIAVIALYLWQLKRVNKAAQYDSKLHKMMKASRKSELSPSSQNQKNTKQEDPFSKIRTRKKLRSEADFLIDKDK